MPLSLATARKYVCVVSEPIRYGNETAMLNFLFDCVTKLMTEPNGPLLKDKIPPELKCEDAPPALIYSNNQPSGIEIYVTAEFTGMITLLRQLVSLLRPALDFAKEADLSHYHSKPVYVPEEKRFDPAYIEMGRLVRAAAAKARKYIFNGELTPTKNKPANLMVPVNLPEFDAPETVFAGYRATLLPSLMEPYGYEHARAAMIDLWQLLLTHYASGSSVSGGEWVPLHTTPFDITGRQAFRWLPAAFENAKSAFFLINEKAQEIPYHVLAQVMMWKCQNDLDVKPL